MSSNGKESLQTGKKKLYVFIIILFSAALFLSVNATFGSAPSLNIPFYTESITPYLEYYIDDSKKTKIEEIKDNANKNIKWERSHKKELNFGFSNSAYWIKFTVNNPNTNDFDWYLGIEYSMLDSIELYVQENDGKFYSKKMGDSLPYEKRDIKQRNFYFYLTTTPGLHTYFMRIESTSSLYIPIYAYSPSSFINNQYFENSLFFLYFGALIVMILYNLFIFMSVRENSYLYYVIYITSFLVFQSTVTGFSFQLLWGNFIWWANHCIPFISCLTLAIGGLFVRNYINTKKNTPLLDKIFIYLISIEFITSLLSLIGPYTFFMGLTTILSSSTVTLAFIASIMAYIKGERAARYFIPAWLIFIIGTNLFNLKTFGLIPSNFITTWSMQIGSAIEVVLLSLGLADRINTMRKELLLLNTGLESLVSQRTEELQATMEELEAMNRVILEARDELWGEMQLAKKIQTIMLPQKPIISGYEIAAYMEPAAEVGGDYYDVINSGNMDWLVIGDVSGHGVPAGLIMMMVQTAIRVTIDCNPGLTPVELLDTINKTITKNISMIDDNRYMTITVIAVFEEGNFIFSGMHQDLLIFRKSKNFLECVKTDGTWLGFDDIGNRKKNNDSFFIDHGDVLLIFTDGITEAWKKGTDLDNDTDLNLYGMETLKTNFLNLGDREPGEIINGLLLSLKDYERHDDITLVVLKRL